MDMIGGLVTCNKKGCGRKILVEQALIGVNHTAQIIVTCWQCLSEAEKCEAEERYSIDEDAAFN